MIDNNASLTANREAKRAVRFPKSWSIFYSMQNIEEEVNSLKDNVLKTEVAALVIGKIYDEEYEKGKELRARFQVAEEVCQQAY